MDGYEPATVAQSSDQISAGKRQVRASQPQSDLCGKVLERISFQGGKAVPAHGWAHDFRLWSLGSGVAQYLTVGTHKEACSLPDHQETATGEGLSVSPSRAYLLWSNFFPKPYQAPALPMTVHAGD